MIGKKKKEKKKNLACSCGGKAQDTIKYISGHPLKKDKILVIHIMHLTWRRWEEQNNITIIELVEKEKKKSYIE